MGGNPPPDGVLDGTTLGCADVLGNIGAAAGVVAVAFGCPDELVEHAAVASIAALMSVIARTRRIVFVDI